MFTGPTNGSHIRRVNIKVLARYQIILLGEQRHIGVSNLPKVVARRCAGPESNPRSRVRHANHYTTKPPLTTCLCSEFFILGCQTLAVTTPRCIELNEHVFGRIIHDFIERGRNDNLHIGHKSVSSGFKKSSCSTGSTQWVFRFYWILGFTGFL